MRFPSGDHVVPDRKPAPSMVIRRGGAEPSDGASVSSYSPVASEKNAMVRPSGLQAGSRSATPPVRVMFRGGDEPVSTQMSPRAETATAAPSGDTVTLLSMSG